MEQILATLIFLISTKKIYMVEKTSKIGIGRHTGVGGKVKIGETIEECALRETFEEIGVRVQILDKVAIIGFNNQDKSLMRVHVFFARAWTGKPTPDQIEVINGKWFSFKETRRANMMVADYIWLPKVLEEEKIIGYFRYVDAEQKEINEKKSWVQVVKKFP